MELRNRVALVTGAGHRVGRALALALASRGARVAVHYHAAEALARDTAEMVGALGTPARAFSADLTLPDAPETLVRDVVTAFGALDIVINSAAMMRRTPIGEVTVDDWDAMFALNLRAPFFVAQAAAPHLARARGAIVNIADLAAFETWPAYVPHGITKAGVVQMTRGLARALAPYVRVNAVAPGVVLLPENWSADDAGRLASTTPLQRNGDPDDVAGAMLYLLEAEFVTGETLIVDGGRHVRS